MVMLCFGRVLSLGKKSSNRFELEKDNSEYKFSVKKPYALQFSQNKKNARVSPERDALHIIS